MKILLIFPQYSHSSEFDSRAPSMSLFYLAALLEKEGHELKIYDASLGPIHKTGNVYRYGVTDEEVADYLKANPVDLVGITCSYTARWRFVKHIAQQVKELYPQVPVGVGGIFPTSEHKFCLENSPHVDFVLLGEAELGLAQVAKNVQNGMAIDAACREVNGIAWKEKGQEAKVNSKSNYNENLDEIPFPAWHLADLNKYFELQKNIFELPAPCLPILTSRSCPCRCTFCNMYVTHGAKWRSRSAENVLDEIEYLIKRFGIHNFYFVDDNFSVDKNRSKTICRGILERKLKIRYNFHNGLSINAMDEELVELFKASGCTSACLAIESGSERIRNGVYKKNLKTEKIIKVVDWYHKAGIPAIGYFMVGGPGETREDFEQSKALISKLPLSLITVSIFTPYPDTQLYDDVKEKGWLVESPLEDESRVEMFTSMLNTPHFTQKDVFNWQRELYLTFIKHHWPNLVRELFRPMGVVNMDMIGKFFGILKFRMAKT